MTLLARILQGLGTIPETTPWKQVNAIKNSFSCDFNKNASREVVPKLLPMPAGFTKDICQDTTNDSTTMDGSRSYGKTLKSPDKFLKDPKDCTTRFSWQRLTYQVASVGSYDERCGTDNKCKVKVGKHNLTRQPLQVADPTNLPEFGKRSLTITYHAASVGSYDERCGTDNEISVR
jgi:hypothetical protein